MNYLVTLFTRGLSALGNYVPKSMVQTFNKVFGTNVSSVPGASKYLATLQPTAGNFRKVAEVLTTAGVGYAITDLTTKGISALASAESEKLGTTDLANYLKGVVTTMNLANLGPDMIPEMIQGISSVLDGKMDNNDGQADLSMEDILIEGNAQKVQARLYAEARALKVRPAVQEYKVMEAKLSRAAAILGVSRHSVIELAALLRDIDASYEEIL